MAKAPRPAAATVTLSTAQRLKQARERFTASWRTGPPLRIEDREGVIEHVTEGERIIFRWGDSRVEWALTDAPGGTRFLVTEHRYAAFAESYGYPPSSTKRVKLLSAIEIVDASFDCLPLIQATEKLPPPANANARSSPMR